MNGLAGRVEKPFTVEKQDIGDEYVTIRTTDNTGFSVPRTIRTEAMTPGTHWIIELRNGSMVTGIRGRHDPNDWLFHKTDEDLQREADEYTAETHRQNQERLEANRADWEAREAALPDWARQRLEHFRANGGLRFDRDGWGYELVACELAALYAGSAGEDTDEIDEIAEREGTTGNQHNFAKFFANYHNAVGVDEHKIPSALVPLTGDPYWLGVGVVPEDDE